MDTLHLPDEIAEEILSRLPVKSLLRFRCVSKSWLSLIGSKRFIKKHLDTSRFCPNFERWQIIFLPLSINPNLEFKRCSMRSYWVDPSVNPLPIDDPINDHLTFGSTIIFIGHSNGLLCIFNKPNSFFLWNPATRFFLQLPKPDGDYVVKCGFGWDGESDAYKVFAVLSMKNESKKMGSIYSSETNSWKAIEEYGIVDLNHCIGEFVCGRMHWIVESGWIETFDLKSEVFGRIELPEIVDGLYPTVYVDADTEGCLRLVYRDMNCAYVTRRIWEMKKYGEDDSWVSFRFPHLNEPGSTYMSWAIENGEVKFSRSDNIVDCGQAISCIESLVLPASENNG